MKTKKIIPAEFRDFFFETVKSLMAVPSPSGYPREIAPLIERLAASVGCNREHTGKGGFVLTYPGAHHDSAIGACAHCDTLGAMVRSVDAGGGLAFSQVGGPLLATLDGEYCTVVTRDGRKYTARCSQRARPSMCTPTRSHARAMPKICM